MLSARHRAHSVEAALIAEDLDVAALAVDHDRLHREQYVPVVVDGLQVVANCDDDVVEVLGQAAHVDADPSTCRPEVPLVADRHPDVRGAEALGGDVCDGVGG